MWDLSCPDWEDRVRAGRTLVPDLPLVKSEADMGLAMFDQLQLPDVPGNPRMADAAGQWFRDIVRAAFGSWDPVNRVRYIRDIFALAPKGSAKTTLGAALLIVALLMNRRPNAEALFAGETHAISERAYEQAVGMIELSPDLKRRFHTKDHLKTIVDRVNKTEGRVRTFDPSILTGSILIFALLDELHRLGRMAQAAKVVRQIRGGLDKTQEGFLLITTTQSDDAPSGVFKDELKLARHIRDGHYRGRTIRPMLPVLHEFPRDIAGNPEKWQDPKNWPMVQPNLGRSVHMATLVPDWESERLKGEHAIRVWASQYLNIEIGVGINDDDWPGSLFWEEAADETLTLDELIERSEVATVGGDGGGLDDLFGVCVIGREKVTRRWLVWNCAFAHPLVLERRKEIAAQLRDFETEGSLKFFEDPQQMAIEFAKIAARLRDAGLLPVKNAVGFDPNNVGAIVEELAAVNIEGDMLRRLLQGPALSPALWGLEFKLTNKTVRHSGLALMNWCVGNVKVEVKGNGNMVTKQMSGRAKIDPFVAMLCAAILMSWNPAARGKSIYERQGIAVVG